MYITVQLYWIAPVYGS